MSNFSIRTPDLPEEYSESRVTYPELVGFYENPPTDDQTLEITEEIPKNPQNSPEIPKIPENSPEISLNDALLAELRRVRNQVIPAYYSQYYDQNTDLGTKDGIIHALHIINGTMSAAEHAMVDQDLSAILAAHHQLRSFGFGG